MSTNIWRCSQTRSLIHAVRFVKIIFVSLGITSYDKKHFYLPIWSGHSSKILIRTIDLLQEDLAIITDYHEQGNGFLKYRNIP